MPNWERIKQLREHLGALSAEQIRMDKVCWINRDTETVAEARRPSCGTVGCIAGHAGLLFGPAEYILRRVETPEDYMSNLKFEPSYSIVAVAERELQITSEESGFMFYAAWHPSAPALPGDEDWSDYDAVDHLPGVPAADVLAYLDKAIAEQDVFVVLAKE